MIEFTTAHYDDLCRAGRVRTEIGTLEDKRKAAIRHFWLYLLAGIVLTVAIVATLVTEWPFVTIILAFAVLIFAITLAIQPLSRAKEDLKIPVLETLAKQGGMEYLADGFDPPVYPEAGRTLFGGGLSGQAFTDLFHGKDPEGRRFAIYEATLTRRQGKNTTTVFSGQVYAFQRRSKNSGVIAIMPDRSIFNFFKPAKGMERVKFDSDEDFERKFEVYAFHPHEALALLGADVRRMLLELRHSGRVFGYVGAEDALVAVTGRNRYEPGSMFRSRTGEERVKAMFDDVCASLAVLRRLKSAFD